MAETSQQRSMFIGQRTSRNLIIALQSSNIIREAVDCRRFLILRIMLPCHFPTEPESLFQLLRSSAFCEALMQPVCMDEICADLPRTMQLHATACTKCQTQQLVSDNGT